MIELDYGPLAILVPLSVAFLAPVFYSFFVDHFDKKGQSNSH